MNLRKIYESVSLYDEVCQIAPYCDTKEEFIKRLEKMKDMENAYKFFPLIYSSVKNDNKEVIDTILEMYDWIDHDKKYCSHY